MIREFRQQHGRAGDRYWSIGFGPTPPGEPPETIVTEWGSIKNGKRKKHGETSDRPGPKGKVGTKAYVSACDNACFNIDRQIRKKMEEGYVEVGLDGRPLTGGPIESINPDVSGEIPFDGPLPKNLCFSKPKNTVPRKHILALEESGNLILTRKVNGMMVIAQVDSEGVVRLYSRRMDPLTDHFPHLVVALDSFIPVNSILLFEAFMGDGNKKSDLLKVQAVMRSKPDRALELQRTDQWMSFYLFRIPVWKGEYLEKKMTCEQMCHLIENSFTDRFDEYEDLETGRFLYAIENFEGTVEEAEALAAKYEYEGWVGYQRDAKFGDYSFSFHGKPDRPSCCFKMKPEFEDDFIAEFDPDKATKYTKQGSWGTGKNTGKLGTMSLFQMDPETGEIIYICEVGSGFTDEQREEFADPSKFPMVVTVKFTSRQYTSEGDATNALEFPRFHQVHPDKTVGEVYNPKIQSP